MRSDPRELGAIFAGGCVGALARAVLAEALHAGPGRWPWATFSVNLAGAFALGLLMTLLHERPTLSGLWRPLIGTGFCGALTTFSTLQVELLRMLDRGETALAVAYAVLSLAGGLLAVRASTRLGRHARSRA